MSPMVKRAVVIFFAMLGVIVVAVGAIILVAQLGDDDNDRDAAKDSEATDAPSPSYVEPPECREEGAALLDDAEAVLRAQSADELARHLAIVQGDHFPSCAGAPVNALAHVVDAVALVSQRAEFCQLTGQWLDYDGDGQPEDLTGLECADVNRAFAKVNRTIDEARDVLDAMTG